MNPRVSVIIAVHNGTATLGQQLDSLTRQIDPPPFEILIMDNNSTDDLTSTVAPFQSAGVRVISARKYQGQSYARNLGALVARGDHLLICDSDDIVSPTWMRGLSEELDKGHVLATGPVEVAELNDDVIWRVNDGGAAPQPLVEPYHFQGYLPFVYGCNFGIRREDYVRLNGMDNSYRGGGEDTDFSWRAQEMGLPLVVSKQAVVHYRLRTTWQALFRQRRGYGRAQALIVARNQTRPLNGMSLKWTVQKTLEAPLRWLKSRRNAEDRIRWAIQTGSIVGNLEGQIRYRFISRPSVQLLDQAYPEAQELARAAASN